MRSVSKILSVAVFMFFFACVDGAPVPEAPTKNKEMAEKNGGDSRENPVPTDLSQTGCCLSKNTGSGSSNCQVKTSLFPRAKDKCVGGNGCQNYYWEDDATECNKYR